MSIQLIVGLGNPGSQYAKTRHNAGAWWLHHLAAEFHETLSFKSKFFGNIAEVEIKGQRVFLVEPTTFMNLSGQAVQAISQFYRIAPEDILVVHDELDFPPGVVKIKKGGGHGGHNGLRDIMQRLDTDGFYRLRLGIGHPGHRSQVHDYVLGNPSADDFLSIQNAISKSMTVLPELVAGNPEQAMQMLHTVGVTEK